MLPRGCNLIVLLRFGTFRRMTAATTPRYRRLRAVLRWTFRLSALAVLLVALLLVFVLRHALYNRMVAFPREAKAWEEIRASLKPVSLDMGYHDFRGVFHSHSKFSHDSEMEFEDILVAAKTAGIDFVFMSDHCVDRRADFGIQWRGIYDGVLFAPGYEMGYGFLVWGLDSDVVLDCSLDAYELAELITEKGGMVNFAHSEEDRIWDLPQLRGMEIYNIHTDIKDESMRDIIPHYLISSRAYPDQTMRVIFDRQTEILENWDRLNAERRITGFAASDAHQNVGFRVSYMPAGSDPFMIQVLRGQLGQDAVSIGKDYLLFRDTGPKGIHPVELTPFRRVIARLVLGELKPGEELLRVDMDPYERSLNYVNTHLLAEELTEESLIEAFLAGRAYISFDMIAPATGFAFYAEGNGGKTVMGEYTPFEAGMVLLAESPAPGRLTLLRDGVPVHRSTGNRLSYEVHEPGNYRVEVELRILGEWVPWIYANPVRIGVSP